MADKAATPVQAPADTASDDQRADYILDKIENEPAETAELTPAAAVEKEDAAAAGEEAAEQTEPEKQEVKAPDTYTVKVNGVEVTATLDELRNGYSRTEDYKSKTAALAEQRRQVEAERAAIAAEKQKYADSLRAINDFAPKLDPVIAEGQQIDWVRLANDDPATYTAKWAQYNARLGQLTYLRNEQQRVEHESMQSHLRGEMEKLMAKVPDWTDDKKAHEAMAEIRKGVIDGYGYTEADLGAINDHRYVLVARDALAYRKLMADRKAAEAKKVAEPPKVQKPGASATGQAKADPRLGQLKQQARKTGRIDDAAEYILAALE